jgi:hypothetical protein
MFFILFNVGLSIVRARRGKFGFGQVVAGRQKLLSKCTTGFELERQRGHLCRRRYVVCGHAATAPVAAARDQTAVDRDNRAPGVCHRGVVFGVLV